MENKNTYHILAISGILFLFIVFLLEPYCIFKKIFNIPCISCGMSRAFVSIIKLDLINAIKYNLLSIPLFISVIVYYILYTLYIFDKRNYLDYFYSKLVNSYKALIIVLIISWIINIVNYM